MIQKLKEMTKRHISAATERFKLLADLKRCDETIKQVFADGIVNEDEAKKLTDARVLKELVLKRLPDAESYVLAIEAELEKRLRFEAKRFNRAVLNALAQKQDQIATALRPFFQNEVRSAKDLVEKLDVQIPAIRELRRTVFDVGHPGIGPEKPPMDFWCKIALRFLDHADTAGKKHGIVVTD